MSRSLAFVVFAVVACATPKPAADTASAAGVDTLKPAVVATPKSAGATSVAAGATTGAKTSGRTPVPIAKSSKVATDTAHLGRDSVIRINPRDPKRQIPTKKP